MLDNQFKHNISKVYELCAKLWPDEFKEKFSLSRSEFDKWVYEKTGTQEDFKKSKSRLLMDWVEALEGILKQRG